jgi:Fe-S cluster assembly iron-binding protein IscA
VFRDELTNLLPHDEDAHRLQAQTFLLSEFLERYAPEWQPTRLQRRALVHGHCHHKSLMGMEAEENLLRRLGLRFSVPDSGCCGMAGAFGFERDHYDISIACAERVLLPAVRAEPEDTLLVTDGFSCREQIAQTTGRRALHLAEVLEMASDSLGGTLLRGPAPHVSVYLPTLMIGQFKMVLVVVADTFPFLASALIWLSLVRSTGLAPPLKRTMTSCQSGE